MPTKQVKIDVSEVLIGMFVSGLDRPWAQTPFPVDGFYIRDMDEIKQLKIHCTYVYIDVSKGARPVKDDLETPHSSHKKKAYRAPPTQVASVAPIKVKLNTYPQQNSFEDELKVARPLYRNMLHALDEVMSQLTNRILAPVHELKSAASDMVASLLRNPDAFSWLAQVCNTGSAHGYLIRSATLAILLGRHIGLARKELGLLALGVLLKDVGKTTLADAILNNDQRTPQEQAEYETFVDAGVEILRQLPGVEPRLIAVVKTHCERINGSGFPLHLRGDKIPVLGKIVGIVTFYDEITSSCVGGQLLAPSQAVSRLYDVRDIAFQEDLVVEFIRSIGLYPTGVLVELNTGEVGVVVQQSAERRLKPRIMLLLNAQKQPLRRHKLLDLSEDDARKQALVDAGKKTLDEVNKLDVTQDLAPGSYNLQKTSAYDHYLMKSTARGFLFFF